MLKETEQYREKIARKLCELDERNFDELSEAHKIFFDEKTKSDYYWAADQMLTLFPLLGQMVSLLSLLSQKERELQYLLQNMLDAETGSGKCTDVRSN